MALAGGDAEGVVGGCDGSRNCCVGVCEQSWMWALGCPQGHRAVPLQKDPRLRGGCSNLLDAACPCLCKVEMEFVHQSYIWGSLGQHPGAFPPPPAIPREPPTSQHPRSPPPSPDGSRSWVVPLQPSTVLLTTRGRDQLLCV